MLPAPDTEIVRRITGKPRSDKQLAVSTGSIFRERCANSLQVAWDKALAPSFSSDFRHPKHVYPNSYRNTGMIPQAVRRCSTLTCDHKESSGIPLMAVVQKKRDRRRVSSPCNKSTIRFE